MPTNVTIGAMDGPLSVVLEDGTVVEIPDHSSKSFLLEEDGFCAILEGAGIPDDPSLAERVTDAVETAMSKLL